jgi:regulator of ribonuclease activity A
MQFHTADLCDAHSDKVQVAEAIFNSFGGAIKCQGKIVTIKLDEDNSDLVKLLQENGDGNIAVVDAQGSYCAIVGDTLMGYAHKNGWSAIIVNGYVRDTENTKDIPVGLWALGTCPKKSLKKATSLKNSTLSFAGINFVNGEYIYLDQDGIITSKEKIVINN